MRAPGLALAAALALAGAAGATDLVNKDGVTYAVTVTWAGTARALAINAKAVKLGVCPANAVKCVVAVEGVGEIEVTGADDVIVANGRLSKK